MSDRNSLADYLTGYVTAMFKDIRFSYLHPREWQRDHSRLISVLRGHGQRTLTLDLPALGKHFDMCLDKGLFVQGSGPLSRLKSKDVQLPVFGLDLYKQIFTDEGVLRVDAPPEVINNLRMLYLSCKKLRLPFSRRSLDNELDKFIAVEEEVYQPSLDWDGNDLLSAHRVSKPGGGIEAGHGNEPLVRKMPAYECNLRSLSFMDKPIGPFSGPREHQFARCLHLVCDIVSGSLGDFSKEEPLELPRHGPGAVSELRSAASKYSFSTWPDKLGNLYPYDYYATPDLGYARFVQDVDVSKDEHPSRIIAVPKTMKGPRLIAAEPSYHQWIQQLVKTQLEARLDRSVISGLISFRDQTRNQRMALLGSVDGGFATIDLSSASDRLSCWLVERVFRTNLTFLERLHACRTRRASYRDEYKQFELKLRKFASMGSAVTFPVQSVVYACVAIAVDLFGRGLKPCTRTIRDAVSRVSVFGDDIIVERRICRTLCDVLEGLGLRVNVDKTFGNGNFRESCGVDAFKGVDVTPPYLLNPHHKVQSWNCLDSYVEECNNFFRRGYWHVAEYLEQRLKPRRRLIPVLRVGSGSLGLLSFVGCDFRHLSKRWCEKHHTMKVRHAMVITKVKANDMPGGERFFQWAIERPAPDTKWVSGVRSVEASLLKLGWTCANFLSRSVTPI